MFNNPIADRIARATAQCGAIGCIGPICPRIMRISIRTQQVLLVLLCSLTSLAVIAIATASSPHLNTIACALLTASHTVGHQLQLRREHKVCVLEPEAPTAG